MERRVIDVSRSDLFFPKKGKAQSVAPPFQVATKLVALYYLLPRLLSQVSLGRSTTCIFHLSISISIASILMLITDATR
jgi:hypothetical protein